MGPNRLPVANAGPDQVVDLNTPVWLDGGLSYDPEGKPLKYSWELVAVPPGGLATLIVDDEPISQLVPDVTGVWVIRLVVNDGSLDSQPDIAQVRASGQPCEQDQDCDDGRWCNGDEYCSNNFCRSSTRDCSIVADSCNDGGCDEDTDQCSPVPKADGTACDDGLYCTTGDECSGGVCSGQPRDCSEAAEECVAGVCDEAGRACVGQPIADGDLCDDGEYCSVNERCSGGACGGGEPRDCSAAGGGCVDGICDENADQCTGDPLIAGTPCNDGQFCTVNDSCDGLGNCRGDARDCSALANQCNRGGCEDTTDQCVAVPANEGSGCDDGLYCTTGDTCQSGDCIGSDRDCDDGDTCTLDDCYEANDACDNQLIPNPNTEGVWVGGSCTDTVDNDCDRLVDGADPDCQECQDDGDCDDSNPCTNNTCQNNNCSTSLVADGTGCNDGRYCTSPDTCTNGVCSGPNRDCSAQGDQCNQGVCNESAGRCESQPIREGLACDDGIYCNVNEVCSSGSCSGGQERDCSIVADDCNDGYCDEGGDQCRQQSTNEGQSCNDGLFCTTPDTCSSGTCSGPPRDCSTFGDQCNNGVCDEAGDTCSQQPKGSGTPCNDGVYCNGSDQCDAAGDCDIHAGDPCSGGAPCNQTCVESNDSCYAPAGTACGSPTVTDCTGADTCDGSGTCLSNDVDVNTPCDDGVYCNGADQCDGSGNCSQHAGGMCPGQVCDETGKQCVNCLADTDCPPCQWCRDGSCQNQPDGSDVKGDCAPGPCGTGLCNGSGSCGYSSAGTSCGSTQDNTCDHPDECDGSGTCDPNYEPSGTPCPDGLYCNGDETCDGSGACQAGADPCPGTSCNETSDQCADCVTNEQCGFCQWCQGGTCEFQPVDTDVKDECSPGECLTGLCDGGGGCGADPDGTPCNGGDGDWCNSTCNGGSCSGGPVSCPDDGNICNGSESCNSSNGACQSGPDLAASDYCDGNDLITCDGSGNMTGSENCPQGCDTTPDPDQCIVSQQVDPSNLDPALLCTNGADLIISSATTINTNDGSITPDPGVAIVSSVEPQSSGPGIRVFSFNNIDIQANVTVTGGNALALLACNDITVSGVIYANSTDRTAGPGGYNGGTSESNGSGYDNGYGRAGPGQNSSPFEETGGGGAAFGGTGGDGGDDDGNPEGGQGGQVYPGPTLVPLVGGSGGGGGGCWDNDDGGPGGGGGGAVQLTAGGTLTITGGGGVHAGAGGGNRCVRDGCGGGGGGAGGGILLEAVSVDMDGTLAANGGGGAGGDEYGSGVNSGNGGDGSFDDVQASGGAGGDGGGRGGDGGAAGTANGGPGGNATKAGGGGGGVGRIRINTDSGSASIGGTVSPNASSGLFTQGTVSYW